MTDTTKSPWVENIRVKRADDIFWHILKKVRPYLADPQDEQLFARDLRNSLIEAGVEVVTDQMRHELGLAPRGPHGWTIEELQALDRRRIELLTKPFVPFLPKKDTAHD